MPSDNLFECWLWKALNISASSHDYRICSSICEGLSSSLLIFINSCPIPSFLGGNPLVIFWKYIMQGNLAPKLTSSFKPHFLKTLWIIQLAATSWERAPGHFSRHPQATLLNKSFNMSKFQSQVRPTGMDIALFILYVLAEKRMFRHPRPHFHTFYGYISFFSLIVVKAKPNWVVPMALKQWLSMFHASITFQLDVWVSERPFPLPLPCRARTFYKGTGAIIIPNSTASWAWAFEYIMQAHRKQLSPC